MSIAKVEKALCSFAAQKTGTAIVLKGEWGTGKTHFWNRVVKSSFTSFSRPKYSYVSLFGLNSLNDLKRSIFENTVECAKAGELASKESVFENLKKLDLSDATTGLRKILKFGKEAKIPFVGSFGGVIDSIQYALTGDTIICIDDFERRGSGLSSRDVLGLISRLVDSKNCSIILILNDGSLDKDDEFFSFSEKVFDYEVTFAPSEQESVNLVFDTTRENRKSAIENAVKLKINNIRLLKKIDFFATILDSALIDTHSKVIQQAQNTLTLAVFSVYGGEKCKVDIDFILAHQGSLASYMPDNTNISTEELELKQITREKSTYLDEYGFGSCDAFDVAIIDLIRKGYADEDSLKLLIEGLEKKIKHDADIALLQKAWDLFHASFSNNDSEVLAAFELAISRALQHFDINDLDSVTSIYYELGQEKFINSVADKYFAEVFPTLGIREKYDIFQWPRNEYLSLKLDQYFESLAIKGSLSELICAVMEGSGFPDGDLRRGIAQATDDEFYNYFAQLNSKEFTRHARALLKCGEVQSHDDDATKDYQAIFIKSYSALLKLSELTPINAIRMNKFKVYSDTYTKHTNTFKNEQQ